MRTDQPLPRVPLGTHPTMKNTILLLFSALCSALHAQWTTNTALNTGDSSTERKITETHSVTRANIELAATRGHDGVTGGHSLSRDDILKTVIRICDEGNVSRTVGIVFKTLDNSGNIGNGAAEVDKTISRTGTTTTATSSNTTLVVTTTSATLERGKLLNRAVGRVGTKMREYKLRCE